MKARNKLIFFIIFLLTASFLFCACKKNTVNEDTENSVTEETSENNSATAPGQLTDVPEITFAPNDQVVGEENIPFQPGEEVIPAENSTEAVQDSPTVTGMISVSVVFKT